MLGTGVSGIVEKNENRVVVKASADRISFVHASLARWMRETD